MNIIIVKDILCQLYCANNNNNNFLNKNDNNNNNHNDFLSRIQDKQRQYVFSFWNFNAVQLSS